MFCRLPCTHHKHLKSTNLLERFNQEINCRTHIVRIFNDEACFLCWVRALPVEIHEEWIDANRYLSIEPLAELLHKAKPTSRMA